MQRWSFFVVIVIVLSTLTVPYAKTAEASLPEAAVQWSLTGERCTWGIKSD